MSFAFHKSSRGRQRAVCTARLVVAVSLVLAASAVAASSALAAGTAFQRGDVLASVGGGINVYAPDGTLKDTFATGSGAGSLCFDPNGRHLIVPGVGLFDTSGNLLRSNWSLAPYRGECAVDGFGHVYVAGGPHGGSMQYGYWGTFDKYDLTGHLLSTYTVSLTGNAYVYLVATLDVAPDQCTIYYGADGGNTINRFNVCTDTQEPQLGNYYGEIRDQLRVLPTWQVAVAIDQGALFFDASGQLLWDWNDYGTVPPGSGADAVHWLSLNPDGNSFWIGAARDTSNPCSPNVLWQMSDSGQVLSTLDMACGTGPVGGIAVFGPPLLGDANVKRTADSNPAGTAEAFVATAGDPGQMSGLHLYVDSASTASQVVLGIYSDRNGHPGSLLQQATISNVMAGSWNYITLPSTVAVTAGQRYWIAVLGPSGGGTIRFRDTAGGGTSQTSSQHKLTGLPATWSTGKSWASTPLSAYGS
jgi:hypothetical protein